MTLRWLGRVAYARGLELQEELVSRRRRDEIGDTLLLLEHPPVITLGRSARAENVLTSAEELRRNGIETFECGRGGDVTYHGPGQLVGYPIIALEPSRRDAHRYLRDIEQALIDALAPFGIDGQRTEGLTGVWVDDDKIAAIGVRLSSGWITSHGFALNVTDDLENFSRIVPCGISDHGVTSVARLTGSSPDLGRIGMEIGERLAERLERTLRVEPEETAPSIGPASRPAVS